MRKPFYISSNCPKHYYAGTQRASSKIGTTENVGDYLYDWFTQGTGGPVDVIGSSFGVLENAEEGVIQVYEAFGIDPPTYDSSPVFIPVQSFVHGGNEVEQYFFHPDHLGSTSYITNLLGEVSQHMEYFAFGETFVEEHRSSNNSPYKFNGKELDEETGWYYYGARYYDPRISVWLSVDPLASYDPIQNSEHYIDGQHNGGIYYSGNLNVYGYTYQNPLRYIDPNGKQIDAVYNKTNKTLLVRDMKIWDSSKPNRIVTPSQYKVGGVKDNTGQIKYNQIMKVVGIFTGGALNNEGTPERNENHVNISKQTPTPNGMYRIVDNDPDKNPNHEGWFRLDKIDNSPMDDDPGDGNTGIRLHIGGESWGCVTFCHNNEEQVEAFEVITKIANSTNTELVKERRGRQSFNPFSWRTKYGVLEVKGEDSVKEVKRNE